ACEDDPNVAALLGQAACPVITYGFGAAAQFRLLDWQTAGAGARFATAWQGRTQAWQVPMAGRYNALNAAAVLVLAQHLGYGEKAIQRALERFQGVKRRQEVRGEVGGVTVIDDFAHHPTAVRLTIEAMAAKYPGRRLWAVFEPRSFTARSPVFREQFPAAFLKADRVLLAPAYRPSAAGAAEALDTATIAETLQAMGRWAQAPASNQAVLDCLTQQVRAGDVVLLMSNGGFDNLHVRLLEGLAQRDQRAARLGA
ncbi:MAG TPA: cyanophycin synthetase, partial [bacterium]|nr:cyanophycin synthetase [bacterium]